MPKQKVTRDKSFLDDCMPWSEAYKTYEESEKEKAMHFFADQAVPERPKTPRKKNKCA